MQNSKDFSPDFHPVHACNDGLFNSASGNKIDLWAPDPSALHISDIAGALAKICRFGGQIDTFYSVAQHSILVAALCPPQYKRAALMHDAAEAYLGDVIKPLKVVLGYNYAVLETLFDAAIAAAFNLDWSGDAHSVIKAVDKQVLEMEHEALQKGNPGQLIRCLDNQGILDKDAWAWNWKLAQKLFMVTYHELFQK